MDVRAELRAPCSAEELFAWVDDLADYPRWMSMVHDVRPAAPVAGDDGLPAWDVQLRARVGPLARSKRLRMIRRTIDAPHLAEFERREADGRRHAPWVLTVRVDPEPAATGAALHVHLHYGGSMWTGGVLERVLADEIERGRGRLAELVTPPTP